MAIRVFVCACLFLLASVRPASAQSIEIQSRTTAGGPPNGDSYGVPAVSANGRFVAFNSQATNITPGLNGSGQVFLVDRLTHTIELITVNTGGPGATGTAYVGTVSDDGRYVAFLGNGLMPSDAGPDFSATDILVRDRQTGTTVELTGMEFQPLVKSTPMMSGDAQHIVWWYDNSWFGSVLTVIQVQTLSGVLEGSRSANSNGTYPALDVRNPIMAAGGRYVLYERRDTSVRQVMRWEFAAPGSPEVAVATVPVGSAVLAANAISRDGRFVAYSRTTGATTAELWLRDMDLGTEQRVDAPQVAGTPGSPSAASISDDGRIVVFSSDASNLVAGDTNGVSDVFVRDVLLQRTARVSVDLAGIQGNQESGFCRLDPTGTGVLFVTRATNLDATDGNAFADVYRRSMCAILFTDGDGDNYGSGAPVFTCAPALPNQTLLDGDCDDSNPQRHPNAIETCNGVDDDCDGLADQDIAGVGFCFGDGSGSACPCGNAGAADGGCGNSSNASGAHMGTLGCASLANDDVVLVASRMPNGFALFFQGNAPISGGSNFGDGQICAGGNIARLGVKAIAGGTAQYPGAGDGDLSIAGGVGAAGVRYYQAWYRDGAAFCSNATFNFTHGVSIAWLP